MKHMFWAAAALAAMYTPHAQAFEPYAEDVLQEEQAQDVKQVTTGCAKILLAGQNMLTTSEAQALLCMANEQLPLAASVWQYGCTNRSELLIGALLQSGVPSQALGRISTFYDTTRNKGPKDVFTLTDPYHGEAFYEAWQLVMGTNKYPRTITLKKGDDELVMDVDGEIQWNVGHIAPTVWVRDSLDEPPQLRVIDPILSPERILTPQAWRSLQNAEPAAMVWGGLHEPPMLLVEYLSPEMLKRLKLRMNIPSSEKVDSAALNKLLRQSSPEVRTDIEAYVLDIEDKSPWHPRKWAGYSFAGDLLDGSGNALPGWSEGNSAANSRRLETAVANLELLQAYHELRESHANEEAFLRDVKDKMLDRNKDVKNVVIYFGE